MRGAAKAAVAFFLAGGACLLIAHHRRERASMELLLLQQQQTLQLLQQQSGQDGALHNAQAPAVVTVATGGPTEGAAVAAGCTPGAATDACLSASLPGLSLPAENADRTFVYSSAGSGTTRHCGGTYTYE
eukprot:COSAG04_NODE_8138_length_1018_cov_0.989119_1_plen_129_part_10